MLREKEKSAKGRRRNNSSGQCSQRSSNNLGSMERREPRRIRTCTTLTGWTSIRASCVRRESMLEQGRRPTSRRPTLADFSAGTESAKKADVTMGGDNSRGGDFDVADAAPANQEKVSAGTAASAGVASRTSEQEATHGEKTWAQIATDAVPAEQHRVSAGNSASVEVARAASGKIPWEKLVAQQGKGYGSWADEDDPEERDWLNRMK
ncbi:unnamed protein product [Zymoseptoria tritici ST99CH_3D1]|nr:unnamed protein product [Zymoseptoria tritici ST99CH_3D1]